MMATETSICSGQGLCLLALDGGGVRGISALCILQRLMEYINPEEPPKPWEYFDMICGTSTGGLIAIMLGRLRMTIPECIQEYKALSEKVFTKCRSRLTWKGRVQGRFDNDALAEAVRELLRRKGYPEDELLKETFKGPSCKVFVCTMSQETSDITLFPNYYSKRWGKGMLERVRIWEAARATSAASSFFDPISIDSKTFVDGATGANNPINELWVEASDAFATSADWRLEENLDCIISIGTGIPSLKAFNPSLGAMAQALIAIATDTEAKAESFRRQHPLLFTSQKAFRFNVVQGLDEIGLEEASRLGEIEAITDRYMASQNVMENLETCVDILKQRQSLLQFGQQWKVWAGLDEMSQIYQTQSEVLSSDILESFSHTKAFQDWKSGSFATLVCKATRQGRDHPCPLAAGLARKIQEQSSWTVLYFDCSKCLCLGETEKLGKKGGDLRKEMDAARKNGLATNAFLRSLVSQLFAHSQCRKRLLQTLSSVQSTLGSAPRESFLSGIFEIKLPSSDALCTLLNTLLAINNQRTLIAVDNLDFLEGPEIQEALRSLSRVRAHDSQHTSLLISGQILRAYIPDVPFVDENTEYHEFMKTLYFDEIDARKMQVSPAAKGTNSWIWDNPVYCAFASNASGILWIRGKPGSGKSVLAKTIQQTIVENCGTLGNGASPLIGDWFYHRRRGGHFVQHASFIRSVLYHFVQQSPEIFDQYFKLQYREAGPRYPDTWSDSDLEQVLRYICQGSTPVLCVVDAVDEAEDTKVLRLIQELCQPGSSKAKFILLSRPNSDIERISPPHILVEEENQDDIVKLIDGGMKALESSIHGLEFDTGIYVNMRLQTKGSPRQHRRPQRLGIRSMAATKSREKRALDYIRETLISKAQGSMLWVKMVLDRLTHEASKNHGCNLVELKEMANQVPKELEEYYGQIVRDLIANKDQTKIKEVHNMLQWICAAGELGDVTLDGLWEACAILKDGLTGQTCASIWDQRIPILSYDELWRKVYSLCGPFIEIYNPGLPAEESGIPHYNASSVVQLMHQSVRDFLFHADTAGPLQFRHSDAHKLVRTHLEHYLNVISRDLRAMAMTEANDARNVVEWLNDQKLLRFATNSLPPCHISEPHWSLSHTGLPLQPPSQQSPEYYLLLAFKDVRYKRLVFNGTCSGHFSGVLGGNCLSPYRFCEHDKTKEIIASRLVYWACSLGLVSAIMNLQALGWTGPTRTIGNPYRTVIDSALFVASQEKLLNISLDWGRASPFSLPQILIADSIPSTQSHHPNGTEARIPSQVLSKGVTPPLFPELMDSSASDDLRYHFTEAGQTIVRDFAHSDESPVDQLEPPAKRRRTIDSNTSLSERIEQALQQVQQFKLPTDIPERPVSPLLSPQPVSPQIVSPPAPEPVHELDRYETPWTSVPWEIYFHYKKDNGSGVQRARFDSWCLFLDLTCGGKKKQLKAGTTGDSNRGYEGHDRSCDDEILIDDVEDAVAAILFP